jgi:2',3'-cyclic-nucleotide 2'-phosphodiesterase (5'-nucleotidase family)
MVTQHVFNEILGEPENIGFIQDAPPPPKSLIEENPHANFVCDAMKDITGAEIAIWNNAGIRNFFHPGVINSSEIKDIAPFFDRISVAMVSEKQLVDYFKGDIEQTYNNPANYKPGLLAASGLRYGVSPSEKRLTFLNYIDENGNEIAIDIDNPREDKMYKLATDEFMMSHGADYPILATAEECLEIYPYDKDVMTCQYIKKLDRPIVINQTGRVVFEN